MFFFFFFFLRGGGELWYPKGFLGRGGFEIERLWLVTTCVYILSLFCIHWICFDCLFLCFCCFKGLFPTFSNH